MAGTVAITIEGVLRSPNSEGTITAGLLLYHGMKSVMKLALLTDSPRDKAEHWLTVNGLRDHAYLLIASATDGDSVEARRTAQIRRLRGSNVQVDMVVEADPSVAAQTMLAGVPTLLFAHPQYAMPSFRPDFIGTPKPWDDIAVEMERQALLADNDIRRTADTP